MLEQAALRDPRAERRGQVGDRRRPRGDEEATAAGSRSTTVGFTVPGAVGEAVDRGSCPLRLAAARGRFSPVCTIMVGRLDDWMKVLVERDDVALHPDAANWAGIAVFKRAYRIYQERGYRTRLLAAAYRHRLHWTELVGGDVVLTMPHAWQVRLNESDRPEPRIDVPVDPAMVDDPLRRIPTRARTNRGLAIDEFASRHPLDPARSVASYHDLQGLYPRHRPAHPDVRAG
jgi:transaldolase